MTLLPTPSPSGVSPDPPAAPRGVAVRWRWYHFYFLLALFDVVVIVGTLLLYHRTLLSYQVSLNQLDSSGAKQHWIADLRLALTMLNEPGNDIFESREVAEERRRWCEREAVLNALALRGDDDVDLSAFKRHVEKMLAQEQRIFDVFEAIQATSLDEGEEQRLLARAAVHMAAMDGHYADALEVLSKLGRALRWDELRLYKEYGSNLERDFILEKSFLGLVIVILVGVFWYGRKLQRTHERMVADQERAVRERQGRLVAIGEVCSAVAHGIRNPLAAITSSAQLALEHPAVDEVTRARLDDVLSSSRRLDRRITRLLDFSRDAARALERYTINDAIAQAVQDMLPRMNQKGIEVVTEFNGQRLTACGDPERFTQSIIELLSNALDHVPAGGRVRVVAHRHPQRPDYALISVIDNGPGIPERLRSRVFELFFTSKPEGTGIGLASVRRAVELCNGQVEVMPPNGDGAHIRITLPLG